MTLVEFRQMWERDGLRFIEEDRRVRADGIWVLYSVEEPSSTLDYGRHYGLIVVIVDNQIMAHNFKNISSNDGMSWRQQVQSWWEEHLIEGLVDEKGDKICV